MTRNRFFLEVDPFPIGATDACFVSTPALRRRLALILRGVQEGGKPICIAAPEGAGKTTLLEQVRRDLGPQWHVASVSGATGLERETFLDAFASAFNLEAGDDETLAVVLQRLNTHLATHLPPEQNALVAVDDADCRNVQTRARLDALLNRRQSPRLRFITTREPTPDDSTDENAPYMLVDVPPLTRDQSDDYIHTRLCVAGLRGDSPFTDDMLRSIHNASGGWPGNIHPLAAKMLAHRRKPGRGHGRKGEGRTLRSRIAAALRSRERPSGA